MAIDTRYQRNLQALSENECHQLADKKAVIVGCGGLGGYVIESLTRIGVGTLTVIDADGFEPSNLNRQLLSQEDNMGMAKVQAAAKRINAINSTVRVETHKAWLGEENVRNLIAGADCVVDCLDNLMSRFWLAHGCLEESIPIVYGAIAGWFGQVCTVFPGDTSFATIYGTIEGPGQGVQKQEGNLPFTASATASFQAAEVVKLLIGRGELLRNRLLMIDTLTGIAEEMELS